MVISPNQVRPHNLVKNAMKMLEAELASAQIQVSITIDKSYKTLSIEDVLLDESRVLQILLNLLTNAIKFTRNQKERCVRIRLAASQSRPSFETSGISYITSRISQVTNQTSIESAAGENVYLIFSVEDTGPGLDKEDMKSLFQRFSQASPKTYRQVYSSSISHNNHEHNVANLNDRGYGGFGLGLFICRELAELQGGQIGLSSVLGQGTTFTFYVQAQCCKSDSPKQPSTPNFASSDTTDQTRIRNIDRNLNKIRCTHTPATPTAELDPKTLHILVVEDNKINQTVLARQLRLLGCTVYTADHGLEALELLSRSSFHISPTRKKDGLTPAIQLSVILMDIEMPIMDGLTCVRRIRQMEAEGMVTHVPVIAVTANARSDQISGAMEAGMVRLIFF